MTSDVSLSTGGTEYLSGSIKWTGLASGTNFGEVVDQLIEIESTQVNRLELWKSEWEAKVESIQGLSSRMASLKSFVSGFNSFSEFYSRTSSSSNSSVVTATNTSTATPGSHTIEVGSDIPGRVASKSFKAGDAIGGAAGATLTITVGSNVITLVEGVDYLSTDDIDDLAAAINTADDNGDDVLETVVAVDDKTRGSDTYKRLIITAKAGGSANAITVDDPTDLNLDETAVDAAFTNSNWMGTSTPTSGGTYTGSTNKTFTFRILEMGALTADPLTSDTVKVQWADDEGNSGEITVEQADLDYEVFQGVTVQFSAGQIIQNDAFTIDAYHPVLQAAQDDGLAQVEQRTHAGFQDLISPVTDGAAGTFSYYYEGIQTTIAVPKGTTLGDLAALINNDENNRGVTATVVNDGQSTSTSYHLVLTGADTGAEHSITQISQTNLTGFDDADFMTPQSASNAMIKVDGFPIDSWDYVQRSTNTVGDIVDGVVLQLQDTGTAKITVSNDVSAIKENIELFVSNVNFVIQYIKEETAYDSDTGESGVMLGNYTYDIVLSTINSILYENVPGLSLENDVYVHLGQIGINTDPDQDGIWVIDDTALDDALNDDLEAVARLFVRDSEYTANYSEGVYGVSERLYEKLLALTDDESGIANVLLDNYAGIIKDIDDKIAQEERRIAMVRERLEEKFARLESTLSELNGQADYVESQIDDLPSIGG